MSVTFSLITYNQATECYEPVCQERHGAGCTSTAHFEADAWMDVPGYDHCFECADEQRAACPACSAEVNVSNANAMMLLERLGVEFDYCGHLTAEDMLGRAMVGNVGRDDSGTAVAQHGGPGTGTASMIDCGVRPGYFEERLGALAGLAGLALERGCLVGWA